MTLFQNANKREVRT